MDLDDEELKATRRMNGSDKEVGSMEENIKILEEKINNIKKYDTYRYDWTETDVQTVEHLIKAYKDLKEELETEQNERLLCHIREKQMIPVQKVEETIEELNKEEQELQDSISNEEREEYSDANISYQLMDIEVKRSVLQELLEKR